MVVGDVPKEKILDITHNVHKHFVDTMRERFHSTSEDYCEIQLLNMLSSGGYNYEPHDILFMNEFQTSEEQVIAVAAHESSHFLHEYARQLYNQGGLEALDTDRRSWVGEVVANLGTMIYLDENFWPIDVHNYIRRPTLLPEADLDSIRAFHKGNDILGKLSMATPEEARELIYSI